MTSKDQNSCLAELNVPGRQLNWSKEIFAAKFNASYKLISEGLNVLHVTSSSLSFSLLSVQKLISLFLLCVVNCS